MTQSTLFTSYTSYIDGEHLEGWCDGEDHYLLHGWIDGLILSHFGSCDGSCMKIFDVRKYIDNKGILPSRTVIDDKAKELIFFSEEPVLGREIDSWYCKRDSQGAVFCTGSAHITVILSLAQWPGDSPQYLHRKHKITLTSCSCNN